MVNSLQTVCHSVPNNCGLTGTGFETNNNPATCTAQKPSDTLCTTTPTCPTGQHQDPTSGQCVSCPANQHWDAAQNACVNTNCPAGQHWNAGQNACVSTSCPTGMHWDIAQNICISNSTCFLGYYWDATQNKCVINSCPAGFVGTPPNCTASGASCPAGYTGTPPNCSVASSCPIGYSGIPPHCSCVSTPICSGNDVVDSCTGALIKACLAYSQCNNGSCIVPAPQIVTWTVIPRLVKKGNTTKVTWDVTHAASCTVTGSNGDSWTGLSDSKVSSPIQQQTIYTLDCAPLAGAASGHVKRTAVVNIAPEFIEK